MPSFKLCMNSRMNLSACTHLQRVHHPRTCAPSKAIHFSWSSRWWWSMSTSWSGKLLWESWTLFGPNTKRLTHGAFIWLNAPLCFCLPLPSICRLLCTSCCMIICFLRCDAATISWIWRSVDEKKSHFRGKSQSEFEDVSAATNATNKKSWRTERLNSDCSNSFRAAATLHLENTQSLSPVRMSAAVWDTADLTGDSPPLVLRISDEQQLLRIPSAPEIIYWRVKDRHVEDWTICSSARRQDPSARCLLNKRT